MCPGAVRQRNVSQRATTHSGLSGQAILNTWTPCAVRTGCLRPQTKDLLCRCSVASRNHWTARQKRVLLDVMFIGRTKSGVAPSARPAVVMRHIVAPCRSVWCRERRSADGAQRRSAHRQEVAAMMVPSFLRQQVAAVKWIPPTVVRLRIQRISSSHEPLSVRYPHLK